MIGSILGVIASSGFKGTVVVTPGPTSGPRYWRVFIDGYYDPLTVGFAEVEMATDLNGADVTTSAQAIYGSQKTGRLATAAFDNDPSAEWYAADNPPKDTVWIGQDFGTGATIQEVRLMSEVDLYRGQDLDSFRLQSSEDLETWNTVWTVTDEPPWQKGETRVYTGDKSGSVGVAARYWRLLTGYGNNLGELEMTAHEYGTDVTTTAQAIYGSQVTGWEATKAFDNIVASGNGWRADTNLTIDQRWVGQDFGTPFLLSEVYVTSPNDSTNRINTTRAFAIQYSSDAVNWVTARTFTGLPSWLSGERRRFNIFTVANPNAHVRWSKGTKYTLVRAKGVAMSKATKYTVVRPVGAAMSKATKYTVVRAQGASMSKATKYVVIREP